VLNALRLGLSLCLDGTNVRLDVVNVKLKTHESKININERITKYYDKK